MGNKHLRILCTRRFDGNKLFIDLASYPSNTEQRRERIERMRDVPHYGKPRVSWFYSVLYKRYSISWIMITLLATPETYEFIFKNSFKRIFIGDCMNKKLQAEKETCWCVMFYVENSINHACDQYLLVKTIVINFLNNFYGWSSTEVTPLHQSSSVQASLLSINKQVCEHYVPLFLPLHSYPYLQNFNEQGFAFRLRGVALTLLLFILMWIFAAMIIASPQIEVNFLFWWKQLLRLCYFTVYC